MFLHLDGKYTKIYFIFAHKYVKRTLIDIMNKINKTLKAILLLVVSFIIILVASIQRDGKVFGHHLKSENSKAITKSVNDTMHIAEDGSYVINTMQLGKNITGYGGNVPLEITVKNGRILNVKALPNLETPDFFNEAKSLLKKWNGKSLDEAQKMKVDAVSGATFSSKAIIANMERGIAFAQKNTVKENWYSKFDASPKGIIALIVVLMAAIIPLFYKNKEYRIIQQVLNIAILGFWCGTFLSYSALMNYMSNGINVLEYIVPVIMLITAFIYPIFGKKQYYCTHICPYGALQELTGKCVNYKIKIGSQTIKKLDIMRRIILVVLMLCMWTGLWFGWIDYEPFSAFIWKSASVIVLVIALGFLLLSTIITRPYCRFVCPMGSLFKIKL